jgi:hypothetical protein
LTLQAFRPGQPDHAQTTGAVRHEGHGEVAKVLILEVEPVDLAGPEGVARLLSQVYRPPELPGVATLLLGPFDRRD